MVLIRYHLFLFLLSIFVECFSEKTEDSLVLVHVIFRHGDRTVEPHTVYPNDPYFIEENPSLASGELTMKGKAKEYKLGKALRRRYDRFLGPNYYPDIVEALSSNMDRTKMSLLLVLAGLFPPNDEELIDAGLNWQPVPYSYSIANEDMIFDGVLCPNFRNWSQIFLNSKEVQQEVKNNKKFFGYLSKNSGLNITDFNSASNLYNCLKTEKDLGLALPEWVKNIYPLLQSAAMSSYRSKIGTVDMTRLAIGYMLQKIINDTINKISGTEESLKRKLHLYSAHEYNITFMLMLFELFDERVPPYGSYLLFEIHNFKNKYGIKIFYQNYKQEKPKLMKLPWCTEICPLKKFISNLADYMPSENLCGN